VDVNEALPRERVVVGIDHAASSIADRSR
jgi:hypothetical protein